MSVVFLEKVWAKSLLDNDLHGMIIDQSFWDRFISPSSVRFQFFLLGNRLNSQTNWKPNWKQTEYCRFISRIVRFGLSVRFAHSVCFKNAKRTENFSSFGVFETNWTCKTNWKWTELCRFIKEQKMNWERQTDWKRTEPGLMNLSQGINKCWKIFSQNTMQNLPLS